LKLTVRHDRPVFPASSILQLCKSMNQVTLGERRNKG